MAKPTLASLFAAGFVEGWRSVPSRAPTERSDDKGIAWWRLILVFIWTVFVYPFL